MSRKIVYRIEDGMDRREIEATTYQMRNFYRQLGDGFFSVLDIMNYIQHQQIVRWCKPGNRILDICCGRGLLLPMLRYERKDIASYTGVDIESKNATWQTKRVTDNKLIDPGYYPFETKFICTNVANMAEYLLPQKFDMLIYTSSIEHMQKETGQQSLFECRKVSQPGSILVITCPNTSEDQSGYDTQYRAHVYEWKRSELIEGLREAGFKIITEWGLLLDKKTLKIEAEKLGLSYLIDRLEKFIPSEWWIPVLSVLFPSQSKEIGFICEAI